MFKSPFLESVRLLARDRKYSSKTEAIYLKWIKAYIIFNGKRHPVDLGFYEVRAFLEYLSNRKDIASTEVNQALCAIMFLYKHVLKINLIGLNYCFTNGSRDFGFSQVQLNG